MQKTAYTRFPRLSLCIVHSALCIALAASPARAATLPAGYTHHEYIQGNATGSSDSANAGYIVTDIFPNPQTDTIEAEFELVGTFQQAIWCARGSTYSDRTWTLLYGQTSKKFRFDYYSGSNQSTPSTYASEIVHATFANNRCTLAKEGGSAETLSYGAQSSFTQTGGPIVLFALMNYSGGTFTSGGNYGNSKLYSFTITRGGEVIHNLVPAVRTSDSQPGLYDNVPGGQFYPGTGSFTMGEIADLSGILEVTCSTAEPYASPSPEYGMTTGLAAGSSLQCSAPAVYTNAACDTAATCTGWKLYDANGEVVSNGTENAFTYTHPTPAAYRRLEWQWDMEYKVTATASAGGTVSPAEQWVAPGATATVTASADVGFAFAKWTGDVPVAQRYDNPVTFPVAEPCEVAAQFVVLGTVRHWTGAGSDALASNPDNWAEGTAPTELASIVFNEDGEGKPCTWDLDIPLQSWFQTNYTSAVTFNTVYAENGFSVLRIIGDCALYSGTWKHLRNAATYRQYRLYASVGGNMTVGPSASISADALGYSQQYYVKTGTFASVGSGGRGGTYGGYGSWNSGSPHANNIEPYGSITAPEDPGSAGYYSGVRYGGGVVRLDVAGALTLDGAVSANGEMDQPFYTGSGGSVYIRAGTISGSGAITTNAKTTGSDHSTGSGGRIAIILTAQGADFSAFNPVRQCSAFSISGTKGTKGGAPGTIYAETPADIPGKGWLIFKDTGHTHSINFANANPFPYGTTLVSDYAKITITNNAKIYLGPDTTLDLRAMPFEAPDTSGVYFNGGTLKPAVGGGIDYDVTTAVGLGGLDAPSVAFHSGSSLEVITADATYTGDMTLDSGVTATVATSLTVDGDLTLNGTIRRPDGPFNASPAPKTLDLHVTGDMTVGATGDVTMDGRGYAIKYCPADQTVPSSSGGSHGGRGWVGNTIASGVQTSVLPYGSVTNPATAGAGGTTSGSNGGGIVKLVVDGALVNNGFIRAESSSSNDKPGSGGSVNVRAGTLSGTGHISADCGTPTKNIYCPAGGGRVAVRLTSPGADFSTYAGEISARGSRKSNAAGQWVGGAGTVWLRTAAQDDNGGALVVDNMFANLASWGDTTVGSERVEGDTFGDVLVGRSARLNLADGATMYVSGVLSNGCEFAAGDGSTVEFTGAAESRVHGNFTFANLSCTTPGKVITVDDGATIAVGGVIALTGTSANPVTMRGATAGQPWTLNLTGSASMNGAALRDCQSTSPITVVNGTDLGGNSANITFVNATAGELITWTGATDTSWASASNWDRARAPIATDRILVPAGPANMPSLALPVQVAELTVQPGASLSLAGNNLSVTGDAVLAGGLVADGAEVLDVGGDLTVSSGFTAAQSTVRLSSATSATLNSAGAALYALEVATPAAFLTNDLSCTSFRVGDGSSAFDLSFANGMTLTANTFSAQGDPATTNGVLRCAVDGGTWNLTVNQPDVAGAAVKGSDASRGVTIVPSDCRDDGGNVNWLFVDDRTHWDGTSWSRGEPTSATDAVVDPGAALTVSSPLAAHNFTVASGASVRITASFEATGAMTLEDASTVTWDAPGTIGGNLVLLPGATLTHTANTTKETYKIDLAVGGSGYVAEGAKITASAKGYRDSNGPGSAGSNIAASYGGRGFHTDDGYTKPCYGSALCPTNCGSGAHFSSSAHSGGGAIKIAFGGPLVLEGSILANGEGLSWYTASGGSIWFTAAALSGSGKISACGGNGGSGRFGGGGRVAIYLTEATSTDAFLGEIAIHSGIISGTGHTHGSPGTYYLQTAADAPGAGVLTSYSIPGKTDIQLSNVGTEIAPKVLAREGETKRARVTASASSYLTLSQDTTVGDIHLLDSSARLYLKGYTLYVRTRKHAVSPNDATQVVLGGGQIIWQQPATVLMLR